MSTTMLCGNSGMGSCQRVCQYVEGSPSMAFCASSPWLSLLEETTFHAEWSTNMGSSIVVTRLLPNFPETAYVCIFPPSMNSNGAVSVSYTHLDVYKRQVIGREIRKHDFYSIYFKNQDIMAILFRKHERLSNLAQNSVKRYILQLYINTAIRQD